VAERGYWALREDCGIVDASDRGKLALSGAGALEFLNGQVTNEVAGLAPGEGRYAAFLTHKGKMLGDVRILATESEVLLDTERVALQALFDMIRHFKLGYDVETHKRTVQCGLFYVRGTRARAVIAEMVPPNTLPEPETAQSHSASTIAGRAVRLIGEGTAAVDVLMAAEDAVAVWDALVSAGAQPATAADAEVVRVEDGVPRYGVDMDDATIPQEAGINDRAVNFTKGCYVGQETVARLFYRGKPNRHLRGLRLSEPVSAGAELRSNGRAVGSLTSSVVSPAMGPIGLGMVRREVAPGEKVDVGGCGASAEVVALPF
jgi:folate-binding protein YgfZ